MKQIKLVAVGAALAILLGCGVLNEATESKLASKAWCAESCEAK